MSYRFGVGVSARIGFLTLFLCASMSATAKDCDPECDGPSPWAVFTSITLHLTYVDAKWSAKWRGEFDHSNYDLKIDIDIPSKDQPVKGTVAMVAGRTMITKGLDLPRGSEIDVLDAPILNMRLLMSLLGRTVPKGPTGFSNEMAISHREAKTGIRFATPSAEGYITAPWRVDGKLEKLPNGSVAYELLLVGGTQDPLGNTSPPMKTRMVGEFSMRSVPVLDDTMPLTGWKVYGVGPQSQQRGSSTILDYGAKAEADARDRTIADIRSAVAEETSPGVADSSKNFTGMWKEKCEQDHGLQIKPIGGDGKYSVSFCGPGGCFEPGTYRPNTFINGDRSYKVVSDSEIQVGGANGFSTYRKCSANPEPALK